MTININDGVSRSGVHLIQKDKIPPVKDQFGPVLVGGSFEGPGHVAANAGVVDLRCVINRVSPFTSSSLVDDTLVFNSATIKDYPKNVLNSIDTISGTEGIFLKKEYVYRHNYIFAILNNEIDRLQSLNENIFSTEYRQEQEWEIKPSVFDNIQKILSPSQYLSNSDVEPDFETACDAQPPVWSYRTVNKDKVDSFSPTNNVQMPIQTASSVCDGVGVHWRLEKKTPLFKGEDFFIEFRRTSASTDINSTAATQQESENVDDNNQQEITRQEPLVWRDSEYSSIDSQSSFDSGQQPINLGVLFYDKDGKPTDRSRYDLRDQAYYVVELGYKDPEHNYLILITQRGAIRLVQIKDGKSRLIDEYSGSFIDLNSPGQDFQITGRTLIESEWFRMTVRNHLGRLVVEFEGDGFKAPPWIITKLVPKENAGKNEPKTDPSIILVSKSKMRLWGGNIQSGFLFGPLQYVQSEDEVGTKLTFPPEPLEANEFARRRIKEALNEQRKQKKGRLKQKDIDQTIEQSKAQVNSARESGLIKDTKSDQEQRSDFSLPINGENKILLTASPHDVEDLVDNTQKRNTRKSGASSVNAVASAGSGGAAAKITTDSAISRSKNSSRETTLFTQDAQLFSDSDGVDQKGFFFKGDVLKEESEVLSKISVFRTGVLIDDSSRNETFQVEVELLAGNHVFTDDEGNSFTLPRCKTPILTMLRLRSEPFDEPRWEANGFDCSQHVMNFTDSWAAQDFTKIEHTGTIRFLLNEEMPAARTDRGVQFQFKDDNDRTEDLLSLRDKAFYIEVWAGYEPGPGLEFASGVNVVGGQRICNYSRLPGFFKLFTGICYGGTTTHEYGARFMDCQIFDYTQVLKDQKFFNSPFYDGVKDIVAVDEILQFAGLRSDRTDMPRFMLKKLAETQDNELHSMIGADGRMSFSKNYALPNAYQKLTQPFFKFKDGDSFYNGIIQIAERGGKLFYFDSYGVARYENYNDIVVDTLTRGRNAKEKGEDPIVLSPLFWFTTNHNIWPGQLVFNNITIQESVSDVFNHVKLLTNTPDFTPIFADDFNHNSLDDPRSEGFIGYLKTLYQAEGVFGSLESAKEIMEFYKSFRRPPYVVKFETYGQPLKALDIVSLNGQRLRVMRINNSIDKKSNLWWQEVECEWLKPIESNIDPGKTRKEDGNPQDEDNALDESFSDASVTDNLIAN